MPMSDIRGCRLVHPLQHSRVPSIVIPGHREAMSPESITPISIS
jgi:hypothetical protein